MSPPPFTQHRTHPALHSDRSPFLRESAVTDDTIVLDEETCRTLEHAVVDFHQRRETLMRLGVPGKRGVLFYGPPDTLEELLSGGGPAGKRIISPTL